MGRKKYSDLHIHIGASVKPHIMWEIAKSQGMILEGVNTYWDFVEVTTASPDKVQTLSDYIGILHQWTEKIQSSPSAIERATYEIISSEYRDSNVTNIELRFNPMKRNNNGASDLDYIINAALQGMHRACLDYSVKAGIILCMAREYPPEKNQIILDKAVKYHGAGVVGIDIAGLEEMAIEHGSCLAVYQRLFDRARDKGLGTTMHTGEVYAKERDDSIQRLISAVKNLKPDRIGHGIQAAYDAEAMDVLASKGTVLEICPSSNLRTRAVKEIFDFDYILNRFVDNGVKFTINTDGTSLCDTNMHTEFELVKEYVQEDILDNVRLNGFQYSFIGT